MAGRYKNESNVATHPSVLSAEQDHEKHVGIAKELMPADLSPEEQNVWMRIATELSKLQRLRRHFVDFVAEYCIVKVRMDNWREKLGDDWSYTTTGRHGAQHKSRPEVAQLNDDWRKWNSLVAQLGLSPATELRFNDKQGSLDFGDEEFGSV